MSLDTIVWPEIDGKDAPDHPVLALTDVIGQLGAISRNRLVGKLLTRRGEDGATTYTIAAQRTGGGTVEELLDVTTTPSGYPVAVATAEDPSRVREAKDRDELIQLLHDVLGSTKTRKILKRLASVPRSVLLS